MRHRNKDLPVSTNIIQSGKQHCAADQITVFQNRVELELTGSAPAVAAAAALVQAMRVQIGKQISA